MSKPTNVCKENMGKYYYANSHLEIRNVEQVIYNLF